MCISSATSTTFGVPAPQHSDTIKHFPFYFRFIAAQQQSFAAWTLVCSIDRVEESKNCIFLQGFPVTTTELSESQTSLDIFRFVAVDNFGVVVGFWEVEIALVFFFSFRKIIFLAICACSAQVRWCRQPAATSLTPKFSNILTMQIP